MSKGKDDKKQRAILEARLMVPILWWAEFLGLAQTWDIGISIVDSIPGGTPSGDDALARVSIQAPYHRTLIEVDKQIADYTDDEVERRMLHELLHVVVYDLASFACTLARETDMDTLTDHVETLTDIMSVVCIRLRYGDDYSPIAIETEGNK